MVTGNFHAVFDQNLYREFVDLVGKGNVTKEFSTFMQTRLSTSKQDFEGIDIQILQIEIKDLEKQLLRLQTKLQRKRDLMERYEKNQQENEKKRLENEKKQVEKQKNCLNCGKNLRENLKKHAIKGGFVCNSCFMTARLPQFKQWGIVK